MTAKRSLELGKERGKAVAESVCLEPAFERLPEVLEKWRKRQTWRDRAEDEHVTGRFPEINWGQYKRGFIDAGHKFVLDYIKELKDDGLLKDM